MNVRLLWDFLKWDANLLLFREKRAVIVHIPKTAGSSIRIALKDAGAFNLSKIAKTKHETSEEYLSNLGKRSSHPEIPLFRFHPSKLFGNPVGDFASHLKFFMFVRDPVDRFASLHRYLLSKQKQKYAETPTDINDFVESVVDGEEWTKPIRSIRPQSSYLPKTHPSWIGRFENLETDFAELCELLEIRAELPHLNATNEHAKAAGSLSATSIEKIKNLYRQDISLLGYG